MKILVILSAILLVANVAFFIVGGGILNLIACAAGMAVMVANFCE